MFSRAALGNASSGGPRAPLILDGAMGTELTRRGVPTDLPLWSATALLTQIEVVEAIHHDYVVAGADILVANTFRTNPRTLSRAGLAERGRELNRIAIEAARLAVRITTAEPEISDLKFEDRAQRVLVAASVAPVEDCYRPDLVPDEATLDHEHATLIEWLVSAGPDLIWIETINTVREARAASRAARGANFDFAVSFVTNESGDLLSGEPLSAAVEAVMPYSPAALGLNCIPPVGMTRNLPRLVSRAEAARVPVAAYAHIGNPNPVTGWTFSESMSPETYATHAARWLDLGATIIGGCCGTTPVHIAAVARVRHR